MYIPLSISSKNGRFIFAGPDNPQKWAKLTARWLGRARQPAKKGEIDGEVAWPSQAPGKYGQKRPGKIPALKSKPMQWSFFREHLPEGGLIQGQRFEQLREMVSHHGNSAEGRTITRADIKSTRIVIDA